ncbi:D-alanyl-D-alanine carboxypeptidase/D-alanyl-D-alanine endopeptidase [Streptacidiphilus fuscans]|uniref:D-alanyl-D-alanine carboxypeptidase/D-alanyl-D-alanine-endopeptidase n=1 Tax=Streptacidiphilus fuscans TaxID=2789292 RepID=A0A931B5E7_9ACTN|nr:D-alanyl-D-alanine carboxypeptidase/D-alanyl-D-alanine-endopeptidase [Streptacidiphilus fuscans]MBF9069742.1 D-alanyl-D-alanine carboxypeptidase/D-alanyl-D-alanine-endopeptidase [Streptacidiphilus fuscans]
MLSRPALPRPVLPRHALRRACVTAIAALSALAVGTTTATAAGATLSPQDQAMARDLSHRFPGALGAVAGGVVVDVASGQVVWSRNAGEALRPASTSKLATALAALTVLGTRHTESTRVVLSGRTVYLVGGGDQHLTSADLDALAATTASALKARHLTGVTLRVDDSLFPAPALSPGWPSGYYPSEVAPVRALAVVGERVMDTALEAGNIFAAGLRGHGVTTTGAAHATAPRGAVTLAAHTSPSLASEIEYMLKESDNDNAEGFARLTALAEGLPADWQGATRAVRTAMARYGVPLGGVVMYDASGLSQDDRMTPQALTKLASLAVDARYNSELWPIRWGLPVAGVDGTLGPAYGRFTSWPTDCAKGRVDAKTGSLYNAIALAGITRGKDGRWKAFSFVENDEPNLTAARNAEDALAATVEGCM